jgi:hypothetical protein
MNTIQKMIIVNTNCESADTLIVQDVGVIQRRTENVDNKTEEMYYNLFLAQGSPFPELIASAT